MGLAVIPTILIQGFKGIRDIKNKKIEEEKEKFSCKVEIICYNVIRKGNRHRVVDLRCEEDLPYLVKVQGRFFITLVTNQKMNVSSAKRNIPNDIKSLKSNLFFISITSILCKNGGQPPYNTIASSDNATIIIIS